MKIIDISIVVANMEIVPVRSVFGGGYTIQTLKQHDIY